MARDTFVVAILRAAEPRARWERHMDRRILGTDDAAREVSAEGLGCMGMSEFYGSIDEPEAIATIHRALELGVDFIDTADMYGWGANERLLARAISGRRD